MRILVLFTTMLLMVLTGCSTTYNSMASREDGSAELILASQDEMLTAAYEAIAATFPAAHIQPLSGPVKGYAWFHMPLLDRTDFRFMLTQRTGSNDQNERVTGWTYNIRTHGTQGLVEARYVSPLVAELNNVLKDRNIAITRVTKATITRGDEDRRSASAAGRRSSGTGFFVTHEGHIITNQHVVADYQQVEVYDARGNIFPAQVLSTDPSNDVALLKIDAKTTPLAVAETTDIRKGAEVFTLGYPVVGIQGQEQKATFGRINALSGIQGDIRYFQMDVPIQPGNSGGPLITDDGNVIGIVTATLNPSVMLKVTGSLPQGVNYAIKSEYFMPLLRFARIEGEVAAINASALNDPARFEQSVVYIVGTSK